MKYDVHIYAVVRVKVTGIEAESQTDAIPKAEEAVDLYRLFDRNTHLPEAVAHVEYADENSYFLVDNQDDEEFANSHFYVYSPDGEGYILDPSVHQASAKGNE